jgi:hypothetical protein
VVHRHPDVDLWANRMLINASEAIAGEVQLVSERARQLFTQSAFNNVLRLAAFKAGNQFIEDRLPVRWSPGWARYQGNYTGKGGRDRIPFYERGAWIRNAQNSHPFVVVTKGTIRLKVIVPVGHPLKPTTSAAFRSILPRDVQCITTAFRTSVTKILNGAIITKGAPNTGKFKHTLSQEVLAAAAATKGRNAKSGIRGEIKELLSPRLAQLTEQHGESVRWNKGHRAWQLNLWRRRAGGAAGPTQSQLLNGQVISQRSIANGKLNHAAAQSRYRERRRVLKQHGLSAYKLSRTQGHTAIKKRLT